MRIVCAYKDEKTFAMLKGHSKIKLYYKDDASNIKKAKFFMKFWGAYLYPFAVAFDKYNHPVRQFRSEDSKNVELDILNYLRKYENE